MLKVFLSYHHKARKMAGRLKSALACLGMDVFLAHEDVRPSAEWQKEILRELKSCDVFIALLTKSFHESYWTDQEIGVAFARKKRIFLLKAGVDPYGFVHKLQAVKVRREVEEPCWRIVQDLASHPVFGDSARDGAINAFLGSTTFEESARRGAALLRLAPFSIRQLDRILEGGSRNQQIYGGRAARDAINKLTAKERPRLKKSLLRKFEKQVKSWPY